MTDKEFIEMSRLLESISKVAGTLRIVFETKTVKDEEESTRTGGIFTTRVVAKDKAKEHPDFKKRYSLLPDQEIKKLVDLIKGCDDWTSDKFKASEIYRMMRGFVSATSGMPVGISGLFKDVRSLCRRPMEIIPGAYPDLYPAFVRTLLNDGEYEKAKHFGQIIPPFTWTKSINELAIWLDETLLLANRNRIIKTKNGPKCCNDWGMADCVFWHDGEPVTAKQLRTAIKG